MEKPENSTGNDGSPEVEIEDVDVDPEPEEGDFYNDLPLDKDKDADNVTEGDDNAVAENLRGKM